MKEENVNQVIIDTLQKFDPEEFSGENTERAEHIAEIVKNSLKEKNYLTV